MTTETKPPKDKSRDGAEYKDTVFLPKTDFPMKAGLPQREPLLLAQWEKLDVFARLREQSRGREKFILHDGPPYANGHIHMGTALNKVLKDIVNRSQQMLGKDANYVPGWDCHGLPIEWEVEKKYRAAGKNKDEVPIVEFRRECRDFAEHWIGVHKTEFKRLGVCGDWANPYTTMAYASEAAIAREVGKFLLDGSLYRGSRPVMWSVVEKTSLAEAEIEYHDHTSKTIWVRFGVTKPSRPDLAGAAVVIWTTTPWTMPGNRAVAYGAEVDYALVEVTDAGEAKWAKAGEKFVVAAKLVDAVAKAAKIAGTKVLATFKGEALDGTVAAHPLAGAIGAGGYDFAVPLLAGDFVTDEDGTGFVHIAPGHGEDDFNLGQKNGIAVPQTVGEDGTFYPHVKLFAGASVYTADGKEGTANEAVIAKLVEAGALLARGKLVHSYPCSWRSKAPLIFRNAPQWFISMESHGLRNTALKAIDDTRFVPAKGKNRLRGMIELRPDWNISRQRAWGVPLPIFVDKKTGEPLRDAKVIERIAAAYEKEGGDAWHTSPPERFLAPDYKPEDYEQVKDIAEVWFDSGATHAFVLETRPELKWPASLYLEGSDQHRGWFHSSLLESCGTRGRAPYDAILTHGFVVDEKGYKMSKSVGNVIAPQSIIDQYGADILRLWVVNSDYSEDIGIGPEILKQQADTYRRLRNTLRYLLGALGGFSEAERLPQDEMPELERYILHRLWQLDAHLRQACNDFEFHGFYAALHNFCAVELSAFYFDIRKDALYCDRPDSKRRRAARTVFDTLFSCLTAWLAPVLCFTAEEAWLSRHGDTAEPSVHLRVFPEVPAAWRDDNLAQCWDRLRAIRRVVTGALERERAEKRIGSSLEAAPVVHVDSEDSALCLGIDLAELCITSGIELSPVPAPDDAFTLPDVAGVAVVPGRAAGGKCVRCWQVLPEVGHHHDHPSLCNRCTDSVRHLRTPA
ncbi:MAG: isoleucine--tRNA ligase [Rhodospirillaceae bacterium]|nr:isoleucine--tRNA ligase [Rhodospirillaceae bacterium]